MLAKSWKGSLTMACFFIVPAVAIAFVSGEIRYFLTPPAERNPVTSGGFAGPGPALIALAILLLSIGLAALVIDRLNESHFGRQGAIRWIVAGVIYGILQQIVLSPIPADFDFKLTSVLAQIGGDLLWKLLSLVLTYLLVFPLFSYFGNWLRNRQKR